MKNIFLTFLILIFFIINTNITNSAYINTNDNLYCSNKLKEITSKYVKSSLQNKITKVLNKVKKSSKYTDKKLFDLNKKIYSLSEKSKIKNNKKKYNLFLYLATELDSIIKDNNILTKEYIERECILAKRLGSKNIEIKNNEKTLKNELDNYKVKRNEIKGKLIEEKGDKNGSVTTGYTYDENGTITRYEDGALNTYNKNINEKTGYKAFKKENIITNNSIKVIDGISMIKNSTGKYYPIDLSASSKIEKNNIDSKNLAFIAKYEVVGHLSNGVPIYSNKVIKIDGGIKEKYIKDAEEMLKRNERPLSERKKVIKHYDYKLPFGIIRDISVNVGLSKDENIKLSLYTKKIKELTEGKYVKLKIKELQLKRNFDPLSFDLENVQDQIRKVEREINNYKYAKVTLLRQKWERKNVCMNNITNSLFDRTTFKEISFRNLKEKEEYYKEMQFMRKKGNYSVSCRFFKLYPKTLTTYDNMMKMSINELNKWAENDETVPTIKNSTNYVNHTYNGKIYKYLVKEYNSKEGDVYAKETSTRLATDFNSKFKDDNERKYYQAKDDYYHYLKMKKTMVEPIIKIKQGKNNINDIYGQLELNSTDYYNYISY